MTKMPEWTEDPLVWDALDTFVDNSFLDFKNLLDVLYEEHYNEFDEPTQALLFGVLGRFMQVYHTRRAESNEPFPSFADAIKSSFGDARVKRLMEAAAAGSVDTFVAHLKGGA
tara:strand:- start:2970 stop:3308 length:339 start_codon:yes stop_codon:yes gene_type:complete